MNEIDLKNLENNDLDVLMAFAKDELGLTIAPNIGKNTLIVKINEANGVETGADLNETDEKQDLDAERAEFEKEKEKLKKQKAAFAKKEAAAKKDDPEADDSDIDDDFEGDGGYNPNLKKNIRPLHQRKDIKKVKINIPETDAKNGGDDVIVQVQGKAYQIKRGVDVSVPMFVVEALKNAVEKKYKEDTVDGQRVLKERNVSAYPFNVVG